MRQTRFNSHNLNAISIYFSRSHSRQYEVNSLLNEPASTPTPSEMLIPDLYLADQAALSETSVIECEIAARNTRKCQSCHMFTVESTTTTKNNLLTFFLSKYLNLFLQVVIPNQRPYIHGEAVKFY